MSSQIFTQIWEDELPLLSTWRSLLSVMLTFADRDTEAHRLA